MKNKEEPKLTNVCIKCGVDLYNTPNFICQEPYKECKGIHLSKETLLIHAAEQKQHLIDMMKGDEELGLYDESREIKVEDIFNDEKRKNIKKFIDEIENPSEPNQALKDATQRYEKYSERFDNKDNEIVEGIFNPDNWGRRVLTEEDIFNKEDIDAVTDYINKETLKEASKRYSANELSQLGFINGAKWQQERMYSEDDMKKAFNSSSLTNMLDVYDSFEEFMEQFKKK
jgi:hypothetical protein